MISHTHKCIFVHIPKTGGTSVESVLRKDKYKGSDHRLLLDYSKKKEFNHYFKFTVVRNTYERVWSLYNYYASGGNQQKLKTLTDYYYHYKLKMFSPPYYTDLEISEKMPKRFQEFCDVYLKKGKPFFRKNALCSQLEFISVNGNVQVDFIARFENLNEDFLKVAGRLGVNEKLPHLRKQKLNGHYSKYYDEEVKQIVTDYYHEEINYFGFKFEG